ncbi:MAG TPA: acyl-CoA dehydrogenase family protein [Ilumatobacteraceae bacterium]|nr:acyl-CoA dehydrogenase family protein [Ilumatobacteraceae bacterium]
MTMTTSTRTVPPATITSPIAHRPSWELQATTQAGAVMVGDAERYAERFAAGALEHDRDGTFAAEHLEALRRGRFLVAPIPVEFGGGGVTSTHDVLIAASRLARGDVATTIGVNMHLSAMLNIVRQWQVATVGGELVKANALAGVLRGVADADVVLAAAISEPAGQDLSRPATTATKVDGGWVVNGTKRFATMSSAATAVSVAVTYVDRDGAERYGFAMVPVGTAGVEFHDDWDALGMRASDSGSVSFHDVRVGPDAIRGGFATGTYSVAMLDRYLASGAFHAAASLGIAEAAHSRIVTTLARRAEPVASDTHASMLVSENVIDLATMRAVFDRAATMIDRYHAEFPAGDAPFGDAQAVFAEVQAAKAHLNTAATRITDRALALSGGAGYMNGHPLSKAWRDARAGAFMHPLGANRVHDFLARTALGLEPRPG